MSIRRQRWRARAERIILAEGTESHPAYGEDRTESASSRDVIPSHEVEKTAEIG